MLLERAMVLEYIKNSDLSKWNWYRDMFSIPLKEDNVYITYDMKSKVSFKNNALVTTISKDRVTPLIMSDTVELFPGDMNGMVEVKDKYTIGDIILNYLYVLVPFDKPIMPFKKEISFSDVEDIISDHLGDKISTVEYELFVECAGMVEQLSSLVTVSSTDKSIRPAPGISEYKRKLYAEAKKKHGDKLNTDIRIVVEIDKKLEAYDREYMKDDPTYNIVSGQKIMGNARKNMYGSIGAEIGIDGKITPIIENSLLEGYELSNDKIASLYNSSRKGSIFRGFMTQFTGADANVTIRVLNTIKVTTDDCKTKLTRSIKLSKDNLNEYLGYYIMVNGSPLLLNRENINDYLDTVINVRSYVHCKDRYCGICSGKQGQDNKNIAIILSTENNAIFTKTSFKAMHDKTLNLVGYDLRTALY